MAAAVPPWKTPSCAVSSNEKGGKLVPDSQFKFFTCYHHLKVSKLDDSVVDLLRFNGKTLYQTNGALWRGKQARVVKGDGASEIYVGWMFIDELKHQWAALSAKDAGWMNVETTNVNAEDGIEKRQQVKSKQRLSTSYVYDAEFAVYDVKGFDIVLGKRWIRDINRRYQIGHDSNELWISDKLLEEREHGQVHYLPGQRPLDIDEGMVEQVNSLASTSYGRQSMKTYLTACWNGPF